MYFVLLDVVLVDAIRKHCISNVIRLWPDCRKTVKRMWVECIKTAKRTHNNLVRFFIDIANLRNVNRYTIF